LTAIASHFSSLDDPRVERTKKHQLLDIVVIAICAVIGGADTWVEVAKFGTSKQSWFETFLDLANGIPSHDTFGRVFRRLDPQQWQDCFLSWVQAVSQVTEGEIVPIDGKTLRRSHDKALGKKAIHMVSAWASDQRLVLGQVKVDEKSNEITAIPALLEMLALSGCIVTIDAMGCQKEIARKIRTKQAHYVLALKDNQKSLHRAVQKLFADAHQRGLTPDQTFQTVDNGHGRHEIRCCWTLSDPHLLADLPNVSAWKDLQSLVMVRAVRQCAHQEPVTTDRYYISSLPGDPRQLLQAVRGHWSIENSLHWVLDIAFVEDECRIRKGYGAQNFAVLRHIALNMLAQETSATCGTKAKRKIAGWDENYLLEILDGFT
jgi:predicted transposase YbfD/YdcC